MFFTRSFAVAFITALYFVFGLASPVPLPYTKARAEANPAAAIEALVPRQAVNLVKVEVPSKSINGQITPFAKRQQQFKRQAVNDFPAQLPSKSVNGEIVPFNKRDDIVQAPIHADSESEQK